MIMKLMNFKKMVSFLGLGALLLLSTACSVGRKGSSAGLNKDRLSESVVLNRVFDNGLVYDHLGEFQMQLNLDKNFAYLDVLALGEGWDPSSPWHTYRILAKRHDGKWWLLAEGLNAAPGETIEIDAHQGHKIYEYVEWIIEFEYQEAGVKTAHFNEDTRIVQESIYWPELDEELANARR